jgi:hypothetical protein
MNRKELIEKVIELGLTDKNPHTLKTVVLEELVANASAKPKGIKTGRPVDPTSARQKRIAELEAKRAAGELKRGRPVETKSARQIRLAELEAKREAGILKRGRNVNPQSARQIRLMELAAKAEANGGVIPKGRPKMVKEEIVEEVAIEVTE